MFWKNSSIVQYPKKNLKNKEKEKYNHEEHHDT
jgi:hypothetical protein